VNSQELPVGPQRKGVKPHAHAGCDRRLRGVERLSCTLLCTCSNPYANPTDPSADAAQPTSVRLRLTIIGANRPTQCLLMLTLLVLKPFATILCVRCGAPGGLFTPSLTAGALLGGVLGYVSSWLLPGLPVGLCAVLGAGAVLAATTQGPISAVVLMMELTGRDRSFILPLLLAASTATLVARSIERRSIYDARLTDEEIEA
jgi:H+/Cl- antiporter ClcA